MKQRDREVTSVLRTALGAIDNAEAVDRERRPGALESTVLGAGRSEVPRRALSAKEMIQIVAGEAGERSAAAELIEVTRPDDSRRLRREAALLSTVIRELEA